MENKYNLRSPAVKRLMREAKELCEATEQYHAQPLEDNLFEWHFTVQGPADSDFESGRYHGRITLPPEYPMKPPSIMLLTPNGRFETGKKICLSMSAHHPETWQPSWSIRTVLLAIIGFMPTKGGGAIGALDYTPDERKNLAKKSMLWKCAVCGCCNADLLKEGQPGSQRTTDKEAKALASQISFKGENEKRAEKFTDTPDGVMSHSNSTLSDGSVNIPNGYALRASSSLETSDTKTDTTSSTSDSTAGQSTGPSVRKRASRRSLVRSSQSGQNSQLQTTTNSSGYFSTLLIVILTSCLLLLLLRRIYKQYQE